MRRVFFLLIIVLFGGRSFAQTLNGQWGGVFDSNGDIVSSGDENGTEYVLELQLNGTNVSGYSYSYFDNRLYYVICTLSGKYDKATKTVLVTETQRIKGNTPPDWSDCLQTHTLTYKKQGGNEELVGSWKSAPGQVGDCGFGSTTLIRRTLSKNLASYNKYKQTVAFTAPMVGTKIPYNHQKKLQEIKAGEEDKKTTITSTPAEITTSAPSTTAPSIATAPAASNDLKMPPPVTADAGYEKRTNEILKTIEIENANFQVDLYDNGAIDGDSVSLFYNGKLILSHRRLSETAITLILNANTNFQLNELTMYAENLGEIPPNTALMVITDGDNRYEINVSSDLQNSGTVRFIYKPKTQ